MTAISHELWKSSVIGRDLTDTEARELFMASRRVDMKKGETLFDEGDEAKAFSLIVEGEVDIEKRGAESRVSTIATLGPGSVVGEMSLLTGEKRGAAARVTSPSCVLLQVEWSAFEALLADNRAAAYKLIYAMARLLAGRLKRINLKVAELLTRDGNSDEEQPKLEEFAKFKSKLLNDWSF